MTTNWTDLTKTATPTPNTRPALPFWFLSFVNVATAQAAPDAEQVPGGTGFLGGVIVEAIDFLNAVQTSHNLGINPGGEVKGTGPLDPDPRYIENRWKNRLLTIEELDEMEDTLATNLARINEEDGTA